MGVDEMPVAKDVDGNDVWAFGAGDICISHSKEVHPHELIFDCEEEPHEVGSRDERGEQSTSDMKRVVRLQFAHPASLAVLISQASELLLKMTK